MKFYIGDTVKIKKIKETDPKYLLYSSFIGRLFKIVANGRAAINGELKRVYDLKGPTKIYGVTEDVLLLKKREKKVSTTSTPTYFTTSYATYSSTSWPYYTITTTTNET